MENHKTKPKIKVIKDGPYFVTGNVPLHETLVVSKGKCYEFNAGCELPQSDEYYLCRCGKSKSKPFCDGNHGNIGFVGTETASKENYLDRAELIEGPGIDLLDDYRCAFGRFCHREEGNVWELVKNSDKKECMSEAIIAASECLAGRLTAVDKAGNLIEPLYEPAIEIIQDPEEEVSAGIFVKGNIPIESEDGILYETRNRSALCRCGKSKNKPFCDASHISIKFKDGGIWSENIK